MGRTLLITREPFEIQDDARPALHIMPDTVYALIVTDPSLSFEESRSQPGYGTIIYKAPAPDGNSREEKTEATTRHRFTFTRKGILSTCTDAPVVLKLLELATKLNAHALNDYGGLYYKEENGLLNITTDPNAKSYIIGDKGTLRRDTRWRSGRHLPIT